MRKNIIIVSGNNALGNSVINLLSSDDNIIVISNKDNAFKQIKEQFSNVVYCECDITNPSEIERIINLIVEKYGNIDVLINNFEIWPDSDIIDATTEEIEKRISINIKGPVYITKIVLEKMFIQENGLIINVDSNSSLERFEYHVINGSGVFVIDGKEKYVSTGDSITIESNSSFGYKGKMVLIVDML